MTADQFDAPKAIDAFFDGRHRQDLFQAELLRICYQSFDPPGPGVSVEFLSFYRRILLLVPNS